jgi:hypothetical protein
LGAVSEAAFGIVYCKLQGGLGRKSIFKDRREKWAPGFLFRTFFQSFPFFFLGLLFTSLKALTDL